MYLLSQFSHLSNSEFFLLCSDHHTVLHQISQAKPKQLSAGGLSGKLTDHNHHMEYETEFIGSDSQMQIQVEVQIHIRIHNHLTLNYCSPY